MLLVTFSSTRPGQGSLASRMRGWKDGAAGLEQRLKDLETIARSLRRRWWLVGFGLALGIIGWGFGVVHARPGTMVLLAGGGLILNALLGIINERGWYRWWLIYALALLDVLLVAVLVVWFGHGGFVVAFLIAVLPYAFDQGHTVGNFLVLTAALAYLGASYLHDVLYGDSGGLTAAGLETVGFITVAWALKQIPAVLIQRIRQTRDVMGEAERGYLAVRAAAEESDELGFLEKSFNRMLEEIGTTISTVQREAGEVAAFSEQVAASAEQLHGTFETGTKCGPRRPRWPGGPGCRSGSAGSRRPSPGSRGRRTCWRSTPPSRRLAPRSTARGSRWSRTRSARSRRRRGSRRGRSPSSSRNSAPGSTRLRGRCSRGRRKCATSEPSRPRRAAPSRSCTRGA